MWKEQAADVYQGYILEFDQRK